MKSKNNCCNGKHTTSKCGHSNATAQGHSSWKLAILLIMISFLLVGAQTCQRPPPKWKAQGIEGMTVSFISNNPPDTVYTDVGAFDVKVQIRNVGGHDILMGDPRGGASLSLTKDDYYIITEPKIESSVGQQNIFLQGSRQDFPGGDFDEYYLGTFNPHLPGQSEGLTTEVSVHLCYPYQTTAVTTVCIDNNKYGQNLRKQACTAKPIDLGRLGQGAPVAVTKIESTMISTSNMTEPMFRVTIENLGKGTVFITDDITKSVCMADRSTFREIDSVYVQGQLSTNVTLNCKPYPTKLQQNKGEVICKVKPEDLKNVGSQTSYITNIQLDLFYNYFQILTKNIEISR